MVTYMKSVLVVHAAVPAEKRGRARLSVRSVVGRRTRTSESEPVCASDSADGVHFIRSRREGRKEAKRRHHPHPDIANSSVCEKIVLSEAAFPCLRSASGIITNSEGDALASGGCSPPSRLSLPLATHTCVRYSCNVLVKRSVSNADLTLDSVRVTDGGEMTDNAVHFRKTPRHVS